MMEGLDRIPPEQTGTCKPESEMCDADFHLVTGGTPVLTASPVPTAMLAVLLGI